MTTLKNSPEGSKLVSENPYFEGLENKLRNEKILKKTIDEVLKELTGDYLDNVSLKNLYNSFEKTSLE
jgi:hypothetical protein